jgi:lysophospholipase
LPKQCDECFKRHCWNGSTSSRKATEADFDLGLRLDPGLSFEKWNESDWSKDEVGGSEGGDDSAGSRVGNHLIGLVVSIMAIVYLL